VLVPATTVFAAPFSYSYQCSTSFTTHYTAAFVYQCAITGFLVPAWELLLLYLHSRQLAAIEACTTPAEQNIFRRSLWTRLLGSALVPRLLRPVALQVDDDGAALPRAVYFHAPGCLVQLVTLLCLLLTFGSVFPLLGVAFAVTMVCYTCFAQLKLGRFVVISTQHNLLKQLAMVEADCAHFELASNWLWAFVTVACWFYAFVLFDTLGDAEGIAGAWWVLLVMGLLPAVLFAGYRVSVRLWRGDARDMPTATMAATASLELGGLSLLTAAVHNPLDKPVTY
jgi:hypothetical protein